TVDRRVALLPSVPVHFGDRHATHAGFDQGRLYMVKFEWLDDRLDLFHQPLPRLCLHGVPDVLRIRLQPELWNIESLDLRLFRTPHGFHGIDDLKYDGSRPKRPCRTDRSAHQLDQKLTRIAVEQPRNSLSRFSQVASRPDAVPARAVGPIGKDADRKHAEQA